MRGRRDAPDALWGLGYVQICAYTVVQHINMTLLPSKMFVCLTMSPHASKRELECKIGLAQKRHWALMTKWKVKYLLQASPADMIPISDLWWAQQHIVIPSDEEIKKDILHSYHSGLITGHPGRDETI
jgi:hypothetical protein